MKNHFIIFSKLFSLLLLLVLLGYLLLISVYTIPINNIQEHVSSSISYIDGDADFTALSAGGHLDTFTDGLMILTASTQNTSNPFIDSLLACNLSSDDIEPQKLLKLIYTNQVSIYDTKVVSYSRYWHGYLVILKPLLTVFRYDQIRFFNVFIFSGLIFLLLYVLQKHGKQRYWFPLFAFLIFINPVSVCLSMQYVSVTINVLVQLIVIELLLNKYRESNFLIAAHFLLFGAITSYTDLLTFPIITLGIPLVYWISENLKTGKNRILDLIKNSFSWAFGYFGMWSSKWLLASVVTKQNVFENAIDSAKIRTSNSFNGEITYLDVLKEQFSSCKFIIFILLLIIVISFIAKFIFQRNKNYKIDSWKAISIIIISIYPLIWYAALMNHSYIHSWMTYRDLSITVFALFTIIYTGYPIT